MTTSTEVRTRVTERQFQDAVVEMAQAFGWRHYHTYDSRRSTPGFPDLVLVRDGRMIIAELKSEKGRETKQQTAWLDDLTKVADGCPFSMEVRLWRPSDMEEIERTLRTRGTER